MVNGCGFEVFLVVLNFIVIGSQLTFWNQIQMFRHSEFQIPESSFFNLLTTFMSRRILPIWDHLRYNMGSFSVLGPFPVQFGGHLRQRDHLPAGIICGPVRSTVTREAL